jgi:serine/threonine protein kinase
MLSAKKVHFPNNVKVSNECKELIRRMLEYDQDKRIDVKEIYNNNFLKKKLPPKIILKN